MGQGPLCLSCDYSMTGGENCGECNEGYYLPEKGEKTSCKQCGENMKKCHIKEENGTEIIVPDECFFPYRFSGNYFLMMHQAKYINVEHAILDIIYLVMLQIWIKNLVFNVKKDVKPVKEQKIIKFVRNVLKIMFYLKKNV